MEYGKLAEQYGSFLVAIGGVSITVLALVLSIWQSNKSTTSSLKRRLPGVTNRAALINSLIIATFSSFVGAQLMAETAASIYGRKLNLLEGGGVTQFLMASITIYIGVTVCMFAIVLLAGEYKKENQSTGGIRTMSLWVFTVVIACVLGWMGYSIITRMPVAHPLWVLVLPALMIAIFGLLVLHTLKHRKYSHYKQWLLFRMKFLRVSLISIVVSTLVSVILFVVSLHQDAGWFRYMAGVIFVIAIMSTCLLLGISVHLLVVKRIKRRPSAKGLPQPTLAGNLKPEKENTPGAISFGRLPDSASARAPKILIISSDTGGGHRSAAAAIVAGVQSFLKGESYAIRVIRAVEESHHLAAKMVALYNWLLRNKQHWMKYYYWFINRVRPDTREFFYKRTVGYVASQFERWCPHVVVSVHPLTQHMFARVLKELGLARRIPLVTVVTDPYYGFWKGWACDDVSLYLVASEDARRQLIDYGISPGRIKISGMPVHPKFDFPGEQAAQTARMALGLAPDKFTVFLNAGWEGGGNIPHIFRELVRGELDVQAIFLAGKNDELLSEAQALASEAKFPVKVIGYSDEVEKLMRAANVMISKLGGLTTFEALSCRVPIIADATTQPMPQEAATANMIAKSGAAVMLQKASDVVPVIRRMIDDSKHYASLRAATITLAIPNATKRIVEEIAALIPESVTAEAEAVAIKPAA